MITLSPFISQSRQLRWRNSPEVNAWTRQNGFINHDDMERWLQRIATDPTIKMFGIESEADGIVGTAGLTSIDLIHGKAEFSLLIGPEYHRKGYGKAALIELLKYAFKNYQLNVVFGESFEGNPAIPLFQKLGFQLEGKLRKRYFKNGTLIDSYMLSILREEALCQSWWN